MDIKPLQDVNEPGTRESADVSPGSPHVREQAAAAVFYHLPVEQAGLTNQADLTMLQADSRLRQAVDPLLLASEWRDDNEFSSGSDQEWIKERKGRDRQIAKFRQYKALVIQNMLPPPPPVTQAGQ